VRARSSAVMLGGGATEKQRGRSDSARAPCQFTNKSFREMSGDRVVSEAQIRDRYGPSGWPSRPTRGARSFQPAFPGRRGRVVPRHGPPSLRPIPWWSTASVDFGVRLGDGGRWQSRGPPSRELKRARRSAQRKADQANQ